MRALINLPDAICYISKHLDQMSLTKKEGKGMFFFAETTISYLPHPME